MMKNANPYTLTFGKEPAQQISRLLQTDEIIGAFEEDPPSNQVFIFTGVRGSGKTVLMSSIKNVFDKEEDWITVELNSSSDMLQSLGAKLYSDRAIGEFFKSLDISLSLFGIDVEVKKASQIVDMETAISKMLKALKRHKKKLLITVDEAVNNEYMRVFAGAFQIFVREDAPIYLLMTGLYENISELQDEKNLTFLYRAPKSPMKPLNSRSMAGNYQKVLGVSEEEALEMAKLTCGYSYAFQVLGYLTYAAGGDYKSVIEEYRQYLSEYVYEKIWSELSLKDRALALAIAKIESGKVRDIREKLGWETNEFNPYRNRLIKKGIINGDVRGYVKFTLPLFADFVIESIG